MRSPLLAGCVGVALLALAPGCSSMFFAETEIEDLCKTESGTTFVASPPVAGELSLEFELPVEGFSDLGDAEEIELDARITLLQLTATSGTTDLSGVERAQAELLPPEGSIDPPVTFLEYIRPDGMPPGPTVALGSDAPVDLLDLLDEDQARVRLTIQGALPQNEWTADVRACLALRVKAHYLKSVLP